MMKGAPNSFQICPDENNVVVKMNDTKTLKCWFTTYVDPFYNKLNKEKDKLI